MKYLVASWNIEKNGQSSVVSKQTKISAFLDRCAEYNVHVIFFCEVHSARIDDYVSHIRSVYGIKYEVTSLPGGHSNAYVVMWLKTIRVVGSQDKLKGLNRGAIVLQLDNDLVLLLAHFKSGQNGLTKDQLQNAAGFLEGAQPGRWAILGDMNWDYSNAGTLSMPGGSHTHACGTTATHAGGNILDWCAAAGAVEVDPVDTLGLFPDTINDMTEPDHRPIIFLIGPS